MKPQNPLSNLAQLEDNASCWTNSDNYGWEMNSKGSIGGEGSPPTGLGLSLELGRGSVHHHNRHGCSKLSSGFTFLQLKELEHQALIYSYIEAGLPVPHHLILPVWKSVASSLSALNQQSDSSFPACSSLYYDCKNSMEPEPGRCRRTDGKKWRCSKDVVPNQKYCERHMHRGRRHRGSRKHVEQAPPQLLTTNSTTATTTSRDVHISCTNFSIISPPTF